MQKLFGGINLTWKKIIIFAIFIGIYTGIIARIPFLENTSFKDITISFEVWVLFGIIIIMNSKSAIDSTLKCFVFFLISQPIVYLVQLAFNHGTFELFWSYYRYWFIWTILTIPMGFIGYYIKKDKWWGVVILTPMLLMVGVFYMEYLREVIAYFPNHLLTAIFCFVTVIIYPLYVLKNKKLKIVGTTIAILILLTATVVAFSMEKAYYRTTIMSSDKSTEIQFDDKCEVYFKDKAYGKAFITYDELSEAYVINVEFKKIGETEVIIETKNKGKLVYDITVERNSFSIDEK